jgi:hypothetical protein
MYNYVTPRIVRAVTREHANYAASGTTEYFSVTNVSLWGDKSLLLHWAACMARNF